MQKYYQSKNLLKFPELVHAFSTRHYGNLSWQSAKTKAKWEETARAQVSFANDLGFSADAMVSAFQTHSKKVTVINEKRKNITVFPADGMVTASLDTPLMVHTADCAPVLMYDPVRLVIAAVHAGWRGVLNGVAVEAVMKMQSEFNTKPRNIIVAIGPALGPCHFEVKEDVWSLFAKEFNRKNIFIRREGLTFLDTGQALCEQLAGIGVDESNIENINLCTYCSEDVFSSWRRDKKIDSAMGSVIALKKS